GILAAGSPTEAATPDRTGAALHCIPISGQPSKTLDHAHLDPPAFPEPPVFLAGHGADLGADHHPFDQSAALSPGAVCCHGVSAHQPETEPATDFTRTDPVAVAKDRPGTADCLPAGTADSRSPA